jgi:hypothetical protein
MKYWIISCATLYVNAALMFLNIIRRPEVGTSSIDWVQQSRFYLKTETETSLRNVVFLNKNRTMDNVRKHNICFNTHAWATM